MCQFKGAQEQLNLNSTSKKVEYIYVFVMERMFANTAYHYHSIIDILTKITL